MYRFPYPEKDTTGSVGRPVPNIDLKLVDENGKDISDYDVRGELCIRGPTVVRGYFENPEANKRDWDEDRFFHTGDIAYVDGTTKKWYIVDRKKVGQTLDTYIVYATDKVIAGTHQSPRIPSSAT
jgi:4-coumarate--CoA ligase